MAYGTVKADSITFTSNSADVTTTLSGIYASTTNNLTLTGTASAVTFTGTTANFVSGVFSTQVSGATVIAPTGTFTSLTGTTATFTSGIIASGTAALPSLAILSDPNTGIFSPGADQLAVATNGTGRLFVDASGNVGIGATPNSYAGYSTLTINNTSGSELDFEVNGTLTSDIYTDSTGTYWTTRTAVPIVLRTNSVERLRIDSAGLVGIGTSSPTQRLTIFNSSFGVPATSGTTQTNGAFRIGANSTSGALDFGIGAGGTNQWIQSTDSNNLGLGYVLLLNPNGGNVGIGTTSPSYLLDVVGTINSTAISGFNTQSDNTTLVPLAVTDVGAGTDEKTWRVAQTQRAAKSLQIGNVLNDASSVANTSITIVRSGATIDNIQFATGSSSERARIDSSGRLLVGTSSGSGNGTLQIQGDLASGTNAGTIRLRRGFNAGDFGADSVVLGKLEFGPQDNVVGALIEAYYDANTVGSLTDFPSRLVFSTTADGSATPTERLRITSAGVLQIADAGNITVGTTTGTKIGTATTQKLGFYNATPVVQPAAVADATDAATVITQLNDLLAKLRTLGIIAT